MPILSKSPRKKRKMTEEQRQAAAERLAKARAAKGITENKSVHESIRNLPEDHDLNVKNIRVWIKSNQEYIASLKRSKRAEGDKKVNAELIRRETYLANLNSYLRDGIWKDMFWGEHGENKMGWKCVKMAYDEKGEPKRTHGVFYPDLGRVWGE